MAKYPKVNYIGNKEKLADWIIEEMPVKNGMVLDIFAGGCSVSYALKKYGYSVVVNDILYADYVIAKALIENSDTRLRESVFEKKINEKRVEELEKKFVFLAECLYYTEEVRELSRLAAIAEALKGYEKYMLLALIRRAMIRKLPYSRMNVPWEQIQKLRDEDYSYMKYKRKRAYHNQSFESHIRENIDEYNNAVFAGKECKVYNCDALDMVRKIDFVDVVYMDPPYPSTMNNYDAFYGMFDEMFDKRRRHVDYTQKSSFLSNMDKLIKELAGKTQYIVLSQNTRVHPKPDEIEAMLRNYGSVVIKEKKHNYQVTGKGNKNSSKELLFILEMEDGRAK
ncbi:MAG: DNA adenine methylase [Lachnospiraceae bacterium]|nr:DNA adenine methylase [Lachnospiraceae bacterium]